MRSTPYNPTRSLERKKAEREAGWGAFKVSPLAAAWPRLAD